MSSFGYLRNLPVDFIKIDGSFVKNVASDPVDRATVQAISDVGHVMGKRTIGEFVSDEAGLAALREIGVDYAQGNWICPPAPFSPTAEADHPEPNSLTTVARADHASEYSSQDLVPSRLGRVAL
jgi:EAL domain-containing protein (putative c-di-GMP-specific phosphodiesterase class I)